MIERLMDELGAAMLRYGESATVVVLVPRSVAREIRQFYTLDVDSEIELLQMRLNGRWFPLEIVDDSDEVQIICNQGIGKAADVTRRPPAP